MLWGRSELADDAGLADAPPGRPGGVALAHDVPSSAEVDEVLQVAERAGATVTRRARTTSYGGYAGCFTDPDGHAWEVAHNPGFPLQDDGTITVPDLGP